MAAKRLKTSSQIHHYMRYVLEEYNERLVEEFRKKNPRSKNLLSKIQEAASAVMKDEFGRDDEGGTLNI